MITYVNPGMPLISIQHEEDSAPAPQKPVVPPPEISPKEDAVPDDFIITAPPKGDKPLPDTIHQVACLYRLALEFSQISTDKETLHLCQKVCQLSPDELDIQFLKLMTPFIVALHTATTGPIRELYKRLKKENPRQPYTRYFFKLVKFVCVKNGDRKYITLNDSRLNRHILELEAKLHAVCELADEVIQIKSCLQHNSYSERDQLIIHRIIAKKMQQLRTEEKALRFMETRSHLNIAVYKEMEKVFRNNTHVAWTVAGGLLAILIAGYLFPSTLLTLAVGPSFLVGALAGRRAMPAYENFKTRYLAYRGAPNPHQTALVNPITSTNVASLSYYTRSTGLFRAVLRQPSCSGGVVQIATGRAFHFNKKTLFNPATLSEMQTLMVKLIDGRKATPEQCLEFLHTLYHSGLMTQDQVVSYFHPVFMRYEMTRPFIS